MKTLAIIILAIALSACTYWDTAKTVVSEEGAKAADRELEAVEWGTCKAATVGSIMRRYGNNPKLWDAWRTICWPNTSAEPPAPVS